jgi:hypothetical protein
MFSPVDAIVLLFIAHAKTTGTAPPNRSVEGESYVDAAERSVTQEPDMLIRWTSAVVVSALAVLALAFVGALIIDRRGLVRVRVERDDLLPGLLCGSGSSGRAAMR